MADRPFLPLFAGVDAGAKAGPWYFGNVPAPAPLRPWLLYDDFSDSIGFSDYLAESTPAPPGTGTGEWVVTDGNVQWFSQRAFGNAIIGGSGGGISFRSSELLAAPGAIGVQLETSRDGSGAAPGGLFLAIENLVDHSSFFEGDSDNGLYLQISPVSAMYPIPHSVEILYTYIWEGPRKGQELFYRQPGTQAWVPAGTSPMAHKPGPGVTAGISIASDYAVIPYIGLRYIYAGA